MSVENHHKAANLITLNKQESGLVNSSNLSVFGNYQKTTNLITLNKQKSGLATIIWTCNQNLDLQHSRIQVSHQNINEALGYLNG